MTFQQLQYVVALEETGSFTAAAAACHVSQPTLSGQIKKLEEEWGTPLFDRTSHPIRPTPTGERVTTEARAALDRLGALAEGIRLRRDDLGGTLEIGVIPTLAPYLLPRVLATVRERLPRVRLNVTEALTVEVSEKVRRGRWDLGLVSTPVGGVGLLETPLFEESFVAYLGPDNPFSDGESVPLGWLEDAGLLLLQEGHCFRDQVLALCGSARRESSLEFESGSLDTLMRLVDAGYGATLIPEGLALDLGDRRAQVRPLEGERPHRTVGALTLPQAPKEGLTAAFLDAVRQALPSRWTIRPR